jgi:hypothetical protein
MMDSPSVRWSAENEKAIATGAQTERRGGVGLAAPHTAVNPRGGAPPTAYGSFTFRQ